MAEPLAALTHVEGNDLYLPTTLALFTVLLLITSLTGHPLPDLTSSSAFGWRWHLRDWLGPFWRVTQFRRVSSVYAGGIHVTKLLFDLLPFIRFAYKRGSSVKNLEG